MRRAPLLILLALLAALMLTGPAVAGPDPAKLKAASESFEAGAKAFSAERWEEAAAHFEAADAAAPSARALQLAIKSRRKGGNFARAATLAALALERYPKDDETKKLAYEITAELAPKLYRLGVACASPCLLSAGNKIVHGEAATRWTLYLEPGKTTIGASFVGRVVAADQSVEAVANGSGVIRFAPPHDAGAGGAAAGGAPPTGGGGAGGASNEGGSGGNTPPDTTEPKKEWRIHPAFFFVGLALTVGAGATTIWSGVDTINDPGVDRVREECAGQGEECQLYQDAEAKEVRTNALIGATAGMAAITLVLGIVSNWGGGGGEKPADKPEEKAILLDPPRLWVDIGSAKAPEETSTDVGVHFQLGGRF